MASNVYEYIHMEQDTTYEGKTTKWNVLNNKSEHLLGIVKWQNTWRQYCFFTEGDCIFSVGCMLDIIDFMKNLK
jgi:hypothetical protein